MITYGIVLEIDVDTGDAVLSYVGLPFYFSVCLQLKLTTNSWYVTLLSIGVSIFYLSSRRWCS